MTSSTPQFQLDLAAALVEFIGTLLFLLMGLGGIQAATVSKLGNHIDGQPEAKVASIENLLYISTSMGLALLATAWTFFRVSGSVFNPNIALALLLTGAIKPMRFFLYVCAEITGAIAAAGILKVLLPGKLAVNCTFGPGVTIGQGLVIEAFLTGALTLTVLFLAVEKHRSTPFAPVAIGLVLFSTHLFGVVFTGAAMNSARALGPAVVTEFTSYHWVYWVGPSLGAVVATLLYYLLKAVDLYALTPKQDSETRDDSPDLAGIEVSFRRRSCYEGGPGPQPKVAERYPQNFGPASAHPNRSSYPRSRTSQYNPSRDQAFARGNVPQFHHHPASHEAMYQERYHQSSSEAAAHHPRQRQSSVTSNYDRPYQPAVPHHLHHQHQNVASSAHVIPVNLREQSNAPPEELKEIPIWSPYAASAHRIENKF